MFPIHSCVESDPGVKVLLLLANVKGEKINSTICEIMAEGQEIIKATNGAPASSSCKGGLMYTTHVEEKS